MSNIDYVKKIKETIDNVCKINEEYRIIEKCTAKNYNFFEICGIEENEIVICKVIYSLLNKYDSHGQGNRFLKLFFSIVLNKKVPDNEIENYWVRREFPTDKRRRIDICILNGRSDIIPIEVKIYAGDQDEQLKDYKEFCDEYSEKCEKIYYLTLDGHKPSDKSIKNETKVECISFKEKIISWLNCCLDEIKNTDLNRVKEVIIHLLNNIRRLCNMDENKNKAICNIFDNKECMEALISANEAMETKRIELLKRIMFGILKKIKDEKCVNDEIFSILEEKIKNINTIPKRKNKPLISYKCIERDDLEYAFGIENDTCFYIGLKYKNDKVKSIEESKKIFELLQYKKNDNVDYSDNWPYYEYICVDVNSEKNPVSFMDINNEMASLLDKEKLDSFIDEAAKKLIALEQKTKKLYN